MQIVTVFFQNSNNEILIQKRSKEKKKGEPQDIQLMLDFNNTPSKNEMAEKVQQKIEQVDLMKITPLEALNLLDEIKNDLKNK